MSNPTRREFVRNLTLAAGAGSLVPTLGVPRPEASSRSGGGPLILDGAATRPAVISSANGLRAVNRAMEVIRGGGDTLEAVVSGVNIVEADPEDYTVGYGGLPNFDGVVQLDSQVWHGPTRGAGAVAALEGYVNPSRVAVAVMRYTDHVLLVGEGAARFAREMGFERRDLLTEESRRRWLAWRAGLNAEDDYLSPGQSGEPIAGFTDPGGPGAVRPEGPKTGMLPDGHLDSHDGVRPWGTIHCSAVNSRGEISAVTTTSGLFFKLPGRVGDSPLPGCGCYADNDVGAAGGTGRGEAVIKTIGGHTIVEEMRRGAHPTDACMTALRRIADWTVERRLLREDGKPNFNVRYYAIDKRGETGGAALWSGGQHAVHDGKEGRLVDSAYLFEDRG
ncbi:MAG: N(4)-(beta-N-acetylglucosaminyl)-L-asparaginase [Gemmatimonadota bacterium]